MSDVAVTNIRTRRITRPSLPVEIPVATSATLAESKNISPTKASQVVQRLSQPSGTSVEDLSQITGWQAHSLRAFLTGLRKKGSIIDRGKREDGVTIYRVRKCSAADGDARDVGMPIEGKR